MTTPPPTQQTIAAIAKQGGLKIEAAAASGTSASALPGFRRDRCILGTIAVKTSPLPPRWRRSTAHRLPGVDMKTPGSREWLEGSYPEPGKCLAAAAPGWASALDNTAVFDVETRNDSLCYHTTSLPCRFSLGTSARPAPGRWPRCRWICLKWRRGSAFFAARPVRPAPQCRRKR